MFWIAQGMACLNVFHAQNGNNITMNDSGITIESCKDLTLKAPGNVKMEGMKVGLSAQSEFKAEGTTSAELSGAQAKVSGSGMTVIKGGMVQIN